MDGGEFRRDIFHAGEHLGQEMLLQLGLEHGPQRHLLLIELAELVGKTVSFLEVRIKATLRHK